MSRSSEFTSGPKRRWLYRGRPTVLPFLAHSRIRFRVGRHLCSPRVLLCGRLTHAASSCSSCCCWRLDCDCDCDRECECECARHRDIGVCSMVLRWIRAESLACTHRGGTQ